METPSDRPRLGIRLHGGLAPQRCVELAVAAVKLAYRPHRPDLPILLAARGPKALALAAEVADGLMVSNMCPPGFAAWAASIARPARLVQYAPCVVAADRPTAMAAI